MPTTPEFGKRFFVGQNLTPLQCLDNKMRSNNFNIILNENNNILTAHSTFNICMFMYNEY